MKVFAASRYGRGEADYLNCPFNKEEYESFHAALIAAERAPLHDFDGDLTVYEGCMPIEVMAARGADTIRFGPLRPVGLRDPRTGHRPWAAVQLRAENTARTLYNLVGFQTNLKWGRAEAGVQYDSGPGARGVCALRRHAPQHLFESPQGADQAAIFEGAPQRVFCRADYRL